MSGRYTAVELASLLQDESRRKLLLDVSGTSIDWSFCTGQNSFPYLGTIYTPRGMKIGKVGVGGIQVANVTCAIDNHDSVLGADILAEGNLTGLTASLVFMTKTDGVWGNPIQLIDGGIVGGSIGFEVSVKISADFGKSRQPGLSVASRTCAWVRSFDGPQCDYTAATGGTDKTCSGTWGDCSAKGNSSRFGGFPFALKPGESIQTEVITVSGGSGQDSYGGGRRPGPPERTQNVIGLAPGVMRRRPLIAGDPREPGRAASTGSPVAAPRGPSSQ